MDSVTPGRRSWVLAALVPAAVMALVVAGCVGVTGTTAASFLRQARENGDPNVRYRAYVKLGWPSSYDNDEQKLEAVRVLSAALEGEKEPVAARAVICRSLGQVGRPEARPALLQAVNDPEPVVREEACRALGRVGRPEDATVLAQVMSVDTSGDCRIAAIEGLATLKAADPRIEALLVESMEHKDPGIRLASVRALKSITGQDLGIEPGSWRAFVQGRR
ncbi:MAG TPA: HEAT repeat domain-containing protein [Isosphaeraceae bacterium]|jgi:HEAT repeat protein